MIQMRSIIVAGMIGSLPALSGMAADAVTSTVNQAPTSAVPEIVITASRIPRENQSEPYTVYRVSATDKTAGGGIRTTPSLLEGIPSTSVQKTTYGQGSPYLRGFTGFRTLFMIDGVRLNNPVMRDGPNQYWNTVDPLSMADYEVVMGPGSVLYGSDAIGGTVNALPVAPPVYTGATTWVQRLYFRGATAEGSAIGRYQVVGRVDEHIGFAGGISLKSFGDLKGGKDVGTQKNTGYQEQDFDGRLDYTFDSHSSLVLCHQSTLQNDIWRTHKTIYGIDWEGLSVGDDKVHSYDQRRDLTYVKYQGKDLGMLADNVTMTLSRQLQTEELYRVKKDSTGVRQGFDDATLGASFQLDSDTAVGRLVYGVEYYRDTVNSYSDSYKADGSYSKSDIQGPVADDATYDSASIYLQDTITLFDGALDLVPGARYTYTACDAERVKNPVSGKRMGVTESWDAGVGSLRALVPLSPSREHVMFAGVAQGFRAPNLSDLTRLDTARSNEIETPSPDLDPEEYVTYEIGIKSHIKDLSAKVGYYYTSIDNMIIRTPTGRTIDGDVEVTKKNSGEGYIQGVEGSLKYAFDRMCSVWISASWMEGEVDSYPTSNSSKQREYISRLAPPAAEIGLRLQSKTGDYWCETSVKSAGKADKLSADDTRDTQRIPVGGTPGYTVVNTRTGGKLTSRISLTIALENIFDEDYRVHGSGVNEPGRNLVLTAVCDI